MTVTIDNSTGNIAHIFATSMIAVLEAQNLLSAPKSTLTLHQLLKREMKRKGKLTTIHSVKHDKTYVCLN